MRDWIKYNRIKYNRIKYNRIKYNKIYNNIKINIKGKKVKKIWV